MIPAAKVYVPREDITEILSMMEQALLGGQLTMGNLNRQFEAAFADYHGGMRAVAVSSGTSALEIILRSLEVTGREVIVPSNTFIATAAAVVHAGGIPVIVDIDPDTLALSPTAVESARSPRTAGIIMVHIGGIISPQIEELRSFAHQHGLFFVEDSAHAHGSRFKGRLAGTFGDAAAFSFFPTKVMTSGEGGMILTTSESLDAQARIYRDQGKANAQTNLHVQIGANWRLSELHAAVGLTQLQRLDSFVAQRQAVARFYDEAIKGMTGVRSFQVPLACESNYYKYIVLLEPGMNRDRLKGLMREQGVSLSGEVYTVPVHQQPVAAGWRSMPCRAAEHFAAHHVCLPLWANMEMADAQRVVETLEAVIKGNS